MIEMIVDIKQYKTHHIDSDRDMTILASNIQVIDMK